MDLLERDGFFKVLFDSIPIMVFIFDEDRRVLSINPVAREYLGISSEQAINRRCGDVLGCINSAIHPQGCGYAEPCESCEISQAAKVALSGNATTREKGKVELRDGEVKEVRNLLISASPLEYDNQTMAVVLLEDISLITELEGLLPICCSCKKIRNDQGYWERIERYIEKHSEAEFTHDVCPECLNKLYPQYAEKIGLG